MPRMSGGRPRHPNKEIEAAVSYLEALGWVWELLERVLTHGDEYGVLSTIGLGVKYRSGPHRGCPNITPGTCAARQGNVRIQGRMMKTLEFTIVASGLDPDTDGFEDRFFEAGCDDATIVVKRGAIILEFAREAE